MTNIHPFFIVKWCRTHCVLGRLEFSSSSSHKCTSHVYQYTFEGHKNKKPAEINLIISKGSYM